MEDSIMELIVESVDVWAASIKDESGSLSSKLKGLAEAGADLDFIIARRAPEKPGTGVVFVTPLRGDREVAAAADLGFTVSNSLNSIRIEGENQPGIAAELTERLSQTGISLRGLSVAVIGVRFILYLALDTPDDSAKAMEILRQL
jgi:hypothetical protein